MEMVKKKKWRLINYSVDERVTWYENLGRWRGLPLLSLTSCVHLDKSLDLLGLKVFESKESMVLI